MKLKWLVYLCVGVLLSMTTLIGCESEQDKSDNQYTRTYINSSSYVVTVRYSWDGNPANYLEFVLSPGESKVINGPNVNPPYEVYNPSSKVNANINGSVVNFVNRPSSSSGGGGGDGGGTITIPASQVPNIGGAFQSE